MNVNALILFGLSSSWFVSILAVGLLVDATITTIDCNEWVGSYDSFLVDGGCDARECCCSTSYVRISCLDSSNPTAGIVLSSDGGDGICDQNTLTNGWGPFSLSPQIIKTNTTDMIGFTVAGLGNDVYSLSLNHSLLLQDRTHPECSSQFFLTSPDPNYDVPNPNYVAYDVGLICLLCGMGECFCYFFYSITLYFLSNRFPHWKIFISDAESRRGIAAKAIQQKREKAEEQKKRQNKKRPNNSANEKNKDQFYEECAMMDSSSVISKMETDFVGLTSSVALQRLQIYGLNVPASEDRWSIVSYLVKSFVSPFNLLLVTLAILTYTFPPGQGDLIGGSIILGMVVLSVVVTFVQDYRSSQAINKLKKMVTATTTVSRLVHTGPSSFNLTKERKHETKPDENVSAASLSIIADTPTELELISASASGDKPDSSAKDSRGGDEKHTLNPPCLNSKRSANPLCNSGFVSQRIDIPIQNIVPGDIVHLTAGSIIPADVRILSCKDLLISQSSLTGESLPVEKSANPCIKTQYHSVQPPKNTIAAPNTTTETSHRPRPASIVPIRRVSVTESVVRIHEDPNEDLDQIPVLATKADVVKELIADHDNRARSTPSQEVSIIEFNNLAFMGSSVASGVATAVVLRTGKRTFLGNLANSLKGVKAKTAFEKGIDAYSYMMMKFMFLMGVFVTIINGLTGKDWYVAFQFAISVAIGLTPEMLPMIVTVNLAKGALDLSDRQVIVKRLNSVQNLGAIDVLCTDKTGTLTDDNIQLDRFLDIDGNPQKLVLFLAFLNSYFQTAFRNLMDESILKRSKLHLPAEWIDHVDSNVERKDEVPFDFTRKRMTVVVQWDEPAEHILICKGAAEEMIRLSNRVVTFSNPPENESDDAMFQNDTGFAQLFDASHSKTELIDDEKRKQLLTKLRQFNEDGYRVVCVAMKRIRYDSPSCLFNYGVKDESDLTLCGFLVFLDPPKEGVEESINSLRSRGVAIKVCTGDNDAVTRHVCRRIGIPVNRVVLGSEISDMDDSELANCVNEFEIFAKLTPNHKERIVKALQSIGYTVGMLGDGINDSAALRAADVGISVDNAVDIAKESADIILLTKSLQVLDRGVLMGRTVFGNIVKYIKMGASSNFGNMFSVLGGSVILPFTPMSPVQILTNNLLYDFSQTAIPFDNVDAEWIKLPKKWNMKDLASFILLVGPVSSMFDYCTWAFSWHVLGEIGATPDSVTRFQTAWFMESLFTQTFIIHLIRSAKIPFIQSRASVWLIATTLLVIAVGFVLPYMPGTDNIPLLPLDSIIYPFICAEMLAYWLILSFVKTIYYRIWPNSSC